MRIGLSKSARKTKAVVGLGGDTVGILKDAHSRTNQGFKAVADSDG